MDVYRTEEEQIEVIKKFIGDHGSKVLAVLILAIAGFFGFQHWQQSQQAGVAAASGLYNQISMAAAAGAQMSDADKAEFDKAFTQLASEYPQSVYTSYATLHKAKLEVERSELDKAAQSLQWVVDANVSADLVALANLRLARVEFARGNNAAALQLLAKDAGPFAYAYQVSKGDVLVAEGKNAEALVAYKKARELKPAEGQFSDQILEMKISNLNAGDSSKLFPVAAETK